jgi:hypothetical protein
LYLRLVRLRRFFRLVSAFRSPKANQLLVNFFLICYLARRIMCVYMCPGASGLHLYLSRLKVNSIIAIRVLWNS